MENWIRKFFDSVNDFSIMDIGILKVCLFSLGILTGIYFFRFIRPFLSLVWSVYIGTFLFIVYRTFSRILSSPPADE
ncbi:hypothetical protein [Alkalicoccus halolimnae]|uniref:Uncharacterized protein n=1 Tax=Alkalicoccus halolimnae TaxID=1667239 RepID=A0A5C7F3Z0_9BACI|nr:hypothetical protein [Alkalicoccus halolimnae]TXF85391.1 hypothetical protein FTX54_09430 [Alkalicoccus halolimnae]